MSYYPRVFVDIDTQLDFMMPEGSLYVPGAEQLIPRLARLFDYASSHGVPVLSSADNHPQDDPEFKQFPPHCLAGTPGQEKLRETLMSQPVVLQPRAPEPDDFAHLIEQHGQIVLTKTVFDVWSNPHAEAFVRSVSVDEYIVFGVTTEYCVRLAVLGLIERGQRVCLVENAVRAIEHKAGQGAIEEMSRAGARRVYLDDVIRGAA